jgi:hypothetical protein
MEELRHVMGGWHQNGGAKSCRGCEQGGAKSIVPKWRIERCRKDAMTELVMR